MSADSSVPAIEASHVDYSFGAGENAKQVLFDNNLAIRQGEIVIMTGPSGSGKTTLLTLIGTLRSLQSGSIRFLGRELGGLSARAQTALRAEIGFIFQHHNLFESLSALDTLRMAMQLRPSPPTRSEAVAQATALLDTLGLGERCHHKPAGLSGGQKQRVAIARALINRPRLILADEPTAALDQESGRIVIDQFRALAAEHGSTILIVTHDNRILDAADRIVNMLDGHIHSDVLIREHLRLCGIMAELPVFQATRPSVLNDLVHHFRRVTVPEGTQIIRQGDIGDRFYILDDGTARVLIDADGEQQDAGELASGSAFGELALLRDEPRAATIVATSECRLLELDKSEFLAVVDDAPSLARELLDLYM